MSHTLFASKSKSSFGQSLVFKPLFTVISHICWWFLIVRFQKFLLKLPSNEPSLAWSLKCFAKILNLVEQLPNSLTCFLIGSKKRLSRNCSLLIPEFSFSLAYFQSLAL
jgi:hypothetical protein